MRKRRYRGFDEDSSRRTERDVNEKRYLEAGFIICMYETILQAISERNLVRIWSVYLESGVSLFSMVSEN